MSSVESIKSFSVEQLEKALSEALEKLTSEKHNVHVSELSFDSTYRGYQSSKMTIYFEKHWEPPAE